MIMSDRESLPITPREKEKANKVLGESSNMFPNIAIDITDAEITFNGNDYEDIMKCKHYFRIEFGHIKKSGARKSGVPDFDQRKPSATLASEYVTYEKINVVVVKDDFTNFYGKVDCFVNTTNNKLEMFSQISKTIKDLGEQPYEDACESVKKEASKLKTTECIATRVEHMKTPYTIHAFCPVIGNYTFKTSNKEVKHDVFSTVFNCLKEAEVLDVQSIAIPFLSTGHGQLDIRLCSEQYAFAILEFSRLRENRFVVETIYFIDIDENKVDIANKVFKQIIPTSGLELLEVPREEMSTINEVSYFETEGVNDTGSEASSEGETVDGRRISDCTGHAYLDENKDIYVRKDLNNPETNEEMREYRHKVAKYDLIIEQNDIRNSNTVAIVCPENEGVERGGLLAAAIKCTFRQSFDERKLSKIQKKAIATTEYITESGGIRYILHILVPTWKVGVNEKQLEKSLKDATAMLFNKLSRHKNRKISSIALPLFGIDNVENDDVVGKCCKWQIEKVVDILQGKNEIPHLHEIRFINRCEKIRNTLITHLKVRLSQ